jgi:hypothetical protein
LCFYKQKSHAKNFSPYVKRSCIIFLAIKITATKNIVIIIYLSILYIFWNEEIWYNFGGTSEIFWARVYLVGEEQEQAGSYWGTPGTIETIECSSGIGYNGSHVRYRS